MSKFGQFGQRVNPQLAPQVAPCDVCGARPPEQHDVWAHQLHNHRETVTLMQAIVNHTSRGEYDDRWQPQTYALPTGRSLHIVKRNLQRGRLQIFADGGNSSAVFIMAAPHNGTDAPGPREGAIGLAPGSVPLEFFHTGDVYAWSSSNGNVCVVEEYRRG